MANNNNNKNNNSNNIKNINIATLSKTLSTPTSLNMDIVNATTATTTMPSLAQIGKQTSFNLRHSQLYESDTDEQTRLIRSPSARKFIIIPATTTTPTSSVRNSRPPSTASLASIAAVLQKAPQPTPPTPLHSKTSTLSQQQQQQQQQPQYRRQISVASIATKPHYDMQASINTDVAHQTRMTTPIQTATTTTATVGGVTFTIEEPDNVDVRESTNGSINIPTYTPSPSMLAAPIMSSVGLRPRYERSNSSIRSIASAYSPNLYDPAHDPNHPFHHHYLQTAATYDGRDLSASSYMYHDHVANQIYSDVTSVRSLASIGIGSTDGKKLVVRRIPNTPNELFDLVNPPSSPLPGIDYDDDDSFMENSDEAANLKPRQQHWSNKMQFVLACIGYSVGLGNVWRFPYMCYKSGGGVFLVPYCIILFICSIPLLYMELSVGQYTGRGPIGCIGQLCPIFKGAGLASVVVSFLMSTYYSVIIGYSIYYFFTSFRSQMPWVDCSNRWNTPDCWVPQRKDLNITSPPMSRTPSEEFFENKVLQISPGIEYPGLMRWELFACLICAWLMVYFATWKSIKSSAKVRYFTATFPFFLIIVLLARAVTLDGAAEGLRYFFRPNWSELKNANVWINAASQNFNSLGITFGSMISFASYNKYNNNILQDTVAVSLVNMITSLLVGIFAFATLGNLALEQNTNVKDVINDGPGLIFVVYPQAMAKMPYAQLWAVMFFFMLLCLGLNSQFAIVEVVVTSIQDGFPNWIKRNLGYHEIVVLFVCVIAFVFGLPNLIQGGIYYFQLMDHYAASVTIMFLAFCQVIAIAWFYGTDRLSKNIKQMTGKEPSFYFKSCWSLFGPCLLFAIWVLSLINYKEPSYHNGRYKYPEWAYGIGWLIASLSLICIPAYAIINIVRSQGSTLFERIRNTMRPNIYECKICGEHHCEHDFPEQEQFMLANELSGNYKLVQQLRPLNMQEKPTQLSQNDNKAQEAAAAAAE